MMWLLIIASVVFMLVQIHDEVEWQMEPETVYGRQRRSMVSLCRLIVWLFFLLYVNLLPVIEAAQAGQ